MATELHILGVRHHGPGSARTTLAALESLRPDAVLIEGPPDAAAVLGLAAHVDMKPPVALLVYEPDAPSNAVFYPLASFSPEWQAMRWALGNGAEARFIDLPLANRAERKGRTDAPAPVDESEGGKSEGGARRIDPLEALAGAAGYSDGEAWWGRLIEERRGDEAPLAVLDAVREAMAAVRESAEGAAERDREEPAREAHMRKCIRAAMKEGFGRVAVVCGAWHAPALTAAAIKAMPAKADDEILRGLPKRKTAATWIPWTSGRLAMASGYGAGVASPGWYAHVWSHGGGAPSGLGVGWMTRVARLMREEDLDASPAHVIEAVRLAASLAALRGRTVAGLDEFQEATLAVLCAGDPLPMRLIERRLIVGAEMGETPAEAPTVPLQRDLAALQKSLRLKPSAEESLLDLDQREENDLARSRLLHRLSILGVPWGERQRDTRRLSGTFHEVWKMQWRPEFEIALIEAARWGNTVEAAAAGCVLDRCANARELATLTETLDHAVLADLAGAVETLVARIGEVAAVGADVGRLMEALPPLARVMRYGNVRKADAALVGPVVRGLAARIEVGIGPACSALDDDAAAEMRVNIDRVDAALAMLDEEELTRAWRGRLRALGDSPAHGVIAGRCWRILLDAGEGAPEDAAARLSLALSRGAGPGPASAWLEGFLSGSGMVLVHDARLLAIVDEWVCSLSAEAFESACPIVRRAFATFEKPERRSIGERIRKGALGGLRAADADGASGGNAAGAGDVDVARAELMTPVLKLILGEEAL